MKKYQYNSELECFERFKDGKPFGKKLWVNITEARRIVAMYELGNSIGLIQSKMQFASKKATGYTVQTIIKLYEDDEIELNGDYPAPNVDFMEMDMDSRIEALDERVRILEEKMTCECNSPKKNVVERIRTWI